MTLRAGGVGLCVEPATICSGNVGLSTGLATKQNF
jgi:hypothetical protein